MGGGDPLFWLVDHLLLLLCDWSRTCGVLWLVKSIWGELWGNMVVRNMNSKYKGRKHSTCPVPGYPPSTTLLTTLTTTWRRERVGCITPSSLTTTLPRSRRRRRENTSTPSGFILYEKPRGLETVQASILRLRNYDDMYPHSHMRNVCLRLILWDWRSRTFLFSGRSSRVSLNLWII